MFTIIPRVGMPLTAMTAIEGHGNALIEGPSPGHCALDPDLALSEFEECADGGRKTEILRAVIDLKTPWAFPPVPNGDLAAAYRDALSAKSNQDATEIECAICLIGDIIGV